MFQIIIWSLILVLITLLYFYLTKNFNYWRSRGLDGPKPVVLFGTLYNIFFNTVHESIVENYRKYGRLYGVYLGSKPMLVIADPQLVKDILIKDFHIFTDRNDFVTGDPINDRSLFNLFGDDWKQMRSIISPAFSSGKMRKMHPLIIECVKSADKVLEKAVKSDKKEIELKKLMGNLTMDVIATCAFATKIDVHNDENNEFVINAKKAFKGSTWRMLVFLVLFSAFPSILKYTGFSVSDPQMIDFFKKATRRIIAMREKDNTKNVDFLKLMIDAKNKVADIEIEEKVNDGESIYGSSEIRQTTENRHKMDITETDILASSFLFFIAGFETTASLLSYLFYSLALHNDCQERLYQEVLTLNGNFDYDSIAKMPYLEACIAETLRLYNPLPQLSRIASQDYKLGETGITIPKGMVANISVQGLHRDPQYYPIPERFNPERFMPANRDQLTAYTYLPFGIGPRNCVGMRFALMEAKTAIVDIVSKYRVFPTANTKIPLEFEKFSFILQAKDVTVGVELRN